MTVRLHREDLFLIYDACLEAERAVHHAAWEGWEDLKQRYQGARLLPLHLLLGRLDRFVAWDPALARRPAQELFGLWMARRRFLPPGLARRLAHRKAAWAFGEEQVRFLAGALRSFVELAARTTKPPAAELLTLRQDLYACQCLIDCRCHGLLADRRSSAQARGDRLGTPSVPIPTSDEPHERPANAG